MRHNLIETNEEKSIEIWFTARATTKIRKSAVEKRKRKNKKSPETLGQIELPDNKCDQKLSLLFDQKAPKMNGKPHKMKQVRRMQKLAN